MRQPFIDWIEPFELEFVMPDEQASTNPLSRDLRNSVTCYSLKDPIWTQSWAN